MTEEETAKLFAKLETIETLLETLVSEKRLKTEDGLHTNLPWQSSFRTSELAGILGISAAGVRAAKKRGRLRPIPNLCGREMRFSREEASRYLDGEPARRSISDTQTASAPMGVRRSLPVNGPDLREIASKYTTGEHEPTRGDAQHRSTPRPAASRPRNARGKHGT